MSGNARGATAVLAGAFETTYATAPVTGYFKLPFISSKLGIERAQEASNILGYGRKAQDPDQGAPVNDGQVVVPVDGRNIGFWLTALFGAAVTTEVSDVFTHVFTAHKTTLPSLCVDIGFPNIPKYGANVGMFANSINIGLSPTTGKLDATIALMGSDEIKGTTPKQANPEVLDTKRLSQFTGTLKRNGVTLAKVVSATLDFNNNLDKNVDLGNGGKMSGADGGIESLTVTLVMRFATTAIQTQAQNGEPCALEFGWSNADASLTVAVPRWFPPQVAEGIDGPQGVQVTYAGVGSAQEDASIVTVTLVNDVETY